MTCLHCCGTGYTDYASFSIDPCGSCNPVTTESALAVQIGGEHYRNMAIQPMEFTQRNLWDGAASSAQWYVARYQRKNGLEDLKKAIHTIQLREELGAFLPNTPPPSTISMEQFVTENGIAGRDREALMELEDYVLSFPDFRASAAARVIAAIDAIIDLRY